MSAITRAPSRAQPDHVEPIGERNRAVESLRGIAALAVVGYHLAAVTVWPARFPPRLILSNGDAGVTLFFVLSGFLLWRPFAKAALDGGRMPGLRQFFTNRALRILPAYWIAITVAIVVFGVAARGGVWRYYLFAQNYSRTSFFGVISPAWSLAVEAIFYLVLPVAGFTALWLARRAATPAGRMRALSIVIGVWFAAGLLYKIVAFAVQGLDATDPLFVFNFPAKAHLFAFGMLLATWHARDRSRPPVRSMPAVGALIVAVAVAVRYRSAATALFFDTVTAVGFTMIVSAVAFDSGRASRLSRALQWRPLVAAGIASYSIYLWHHLLIDRLAEAGVLRSPLSWLPVNIAIVLALTLAVAAASYLLIERPFLKLRRRWS